MHVLILPSWYPRFEGDAEGSFFRDQAHGLANAGLKVGIVFPDLRGPARYFHKDRQSGIVVRQDGPVAEVRSHGFNWASRSMAGFEWLWRRHAEKALEGYFREFGRPDVIHAHSMLPAAVVAAASSRRYNIPFVVTEHSSMHIVGLRSAALRNKCKYVASASSENLAVSKIFVDKLESLYGGNWSFLPNIVSNRFLEHRLISQGNSEFRIVSVATLKPMKRMDLVIDAVSILRKRNFDVALTIIGDGEDRSRLEQMAATPETEGRVEFAGRVTISDMPAAMAKGHLLVSASEFETFGVTLIEGLALGMPVVATRSGGPDSIVTPDVGKLVDRWNATAMADAIEEVIQNINRYKPADMRAYCQARYSAPVISEALKSIYANAMAHGAK